MERIWNMLFVYRKVSLVTYNCLKMLCKILSINTKNYFDAFRNLHFIFHFYPSDNRTHQDHQRFRCSKAYASIWESSLYIPTYPFILHAWWLNSIANNFVHPLAVTHLTENIENHEKRSNTPSLSLLL